MKLIIGLGNPGPEYTHTRHNVGFMFVEELAKNWGASFQAKARFKADIAEAMIGAEKVWFVKPTTFYNLVGESVAAIMHFYQLTNQDILVIHDDMALPLGTMRVRLSGSSAGNNGIKSLNSHLGEHYTRLRVGIWQPGREHIDASSFVLGKLSQKEKGGLNSLLPAAVACATTFVQQGLEPTTVVGEGVEKE